MEIRELKAYMPHDSRVLQKKILSFIIKLYIFIKMYFMLKRKFSRIAVIITAVIIGLLTYVFISFRFFSYSSISSNGYSYNWPTDDTTFRNAFYTYEINDSLPHYQYRQTEDSFKRIAYEIDQQNKGHFFQTKSWNVFGFSKIRNPFKLNNRVKARELLFKERIDSIRQAAATLKDPDSLNRLNEYEKELTQTWSFRKYDEIYDTLAPDDFDYFITLNGYKLPHDDKFFVQHGNFYIAHLVRDNSKKKENGEVSTYFIRKQVKTRYHENENSISIPVSRSWYTILNSTAFIMTTLFWIVYVYIIFGLPASILLSVSRGKAFTAGNIRDMKIIYRFLLLIGLLKSVFPYLKEWILSDYINGTYIGTEGMNSFISALPLLLSGAAVFLICKAFQKGYKLQQEEDFTV